MGMLIILVFKALSSPTPSQSSYLWENTSTDQDSSSLRDAQMLIEDVKRIVHELDQGQQLSSIGVELVDNELAILYMNSKKSEVMLGPTLKACPGEC